MRRPKIDTRPLDVRMRDLRVLISVLAEQQREAQSELSRLEAQAGVVRDQHPVGSGADAGAP